MMTTREVAAYLRIKERKVYDLVKSGRVPCTRAAGKWLFPKQLVELWLLESTRPRPGAGRARRPPPVIAGSHDPLLEWCLKEAGAGLALLPGGSLDGIERLAGGEAAVCGLHVIDPDTGGYNVAVIKRALAGLDVVAITWAWRVQGLVVAPGNPLGLGGLADLRAKGARVVRRQDEAGSQLLLVHLLAEAGLALDDLALTPSPARGETDLALAVLEGKADAGLAVAAVARQLRLDFVPLHRERYDLVMRRRDYFEPPMQALLAFTRGAAFAARVEELGGYDRTELGAVAHNA